jgi:hypothetical protein
MLVSGDRWLAGCVSGGCLSDDAPRRASLQDGPVVVTYATADDAVAPAATDRRCAARAHSGAQNGASHSHVRFAAETTGTLVT